MNNSQPKRGLTAKQRVFVSEYLIDLNATQAAIRAGYSQKTAEVIASENLRKPNISKAIQEAMNKRAKDTEINSQFVLNGIRKIIERCEALEPVHDKEGNETGELQFKPGEALRGYELLGKHLKLFTDKVEIEVNETLADRIKEARERSKKG